MEKDKVVSKKGDVAIFFNKYFNYLTESINIKKWPIQISMQFYSKKPAFSSIQKHEDHSSIMKEKSANLSFTSFDFDS